ncbi:MAG TPA: hypothetical protein GXZ82_10115 [Firmicutes bacterium]|jgi:hypothetical protein|nr:hypothetical protein [Bacillota bacterium]
MFDASAFCGGWAYRYAAERTVGEVCALLAQNGLQGAAMTPADAVLHPEPMAANRAFLQQVNAGVQDAECTVYAVPVIDPSLPGWRGHLQECAALSNKRIAAYKVFPNFHGYDLEAPGINALAEELARSNTTLCIQLRMEDDRAQHHTLRLPVIPMAAVAAFAQRHPTLNILLCAPLMAEARAVSQVENISVEMSFMETGDLLNVALGHMGAHRLLLGSHAPLFIPAVGVVKAATDNIGVRAAICTENFRRLFR